MNLYLLICSVFLGYVAEGQALKCWECNDEAYDGNPLGHNCYDKVTATNTCTAVQLCLSKFILKDGLPMSVRRGCDYISGYQEQGNIQCDVSINQNILYPNTKALTTCYYSCNTTDNCNNISTTKLKPCTKLCPAGISYCDYLTGNCVCKTPAYKFPNCPAEPSPTTYRSCVQCNGETDDNCHNMTKSSRCSGNETSQPFCSTTKTSTITPNVTVVRNIVTRGCAYSFTSAYECFFSKGSDSSLSTYTEYTCISTCETDGCNTGIT
uniref:UPAR/Ly6 domain-containing protein n=3 Tax=Ciona intestinalis TaxID=7719 RepID=F6UHF9_CIOIN